AAREFGVPAPEIEAVLARLVERMAERGENSTPMRIVGAHERAVSALCSAGILHAGEGQLSFVHAGFLDYLIAERALRSIGRDATRIMEWIRAHQSLFGREQLRHFLILLRDEERPIYAEVLGALVAQPGIRFHVQHLVLGLLGEASP